MKGLTYPVNLSPLTRDHPGSLSIAINLDLKLVTKYCCAKIEYEWMYFLFNINRWHWTLENLPEQVSGLKHKMCVSQFIWHYPSYSVNKAIEVGETVLLVLATNKPSETNTFTFQYLISKLYTKAIIFIKFQIPTAFQVFNKLNFYKGYRLPISYLYVNSFTPVVQNIWQQQLFPININIISTLIWNFRPLNIVKSFKHFEPYTIGK